MPFPSFHTFFVPIVHSLRARGGSATIDELEEAVASASHLSEEQRAQLHGEGPRTEFSYRLAWARTYLKKGGALDNSERGVWHLTPAGKEATRDGAPAIDLVDGDALCDLLKTLKIGVKVETVEAVTVDQASLSAV